MLGQNQSILKPKVLPSEQSDRDEMIRSILSKIVKEHSINQFDDNIQVQKPKSLRLSMTMPRKAERECSKFKRQQSFNSSNRFEEESSVDNPNTKMLQK